jgi:hypothetical protein
MCETAKKMRAFKLKRFAKDAKKEGIGDAELCAAIVELEEGKGENLGGNVWKKRLNENRSRSLLITKPKDFWVFAYLFSKSDRENIDADELTAFKKVGSRSWCERLGGDGCARCGGKSCGDMS